MSISMGQQMLEATKRLYNRRTSTLTHGGKLLIDATQQHGAAELGLQMFQETPQMVGALHTQPTFVTYAAANLVVRCSMTALDLCAASARWTVEPDPSNSDVMEYDVEKWGYPKSKSLEQSLHIDLREWLSATRDAKAYEDLKVCRDAFTHRHVRMDATVYPATIGVNRDFHEVAAPSQHKIHAGGKVYPLDEILPTSLDFADERLESYALAVLRAVPEDG
jgi:hypothetical protein